MLQLYSTVDRFHPFLHQNQLPFCQEIAWQLHCLVLSPGGYSIDTQMSRREYARLHPKIQNLKIKHELWILGPYVLLFYILWSVEPGLVLSHWPCAAFSGGMDFVVTKYITHQIHWIRKIGRRESSWESYSNYVWSQSSVPFPISTSNYIGEQLLRLLRCN